MKNIYTTKKLFVLLPVLFFLMVVPPGNQIKAQEAVIYSTGFESDEGFTAGTTYNNTTINYNGPANQQWGTYYGTVSTTGTISGAQSMQMRWYTSAPTNFGYTFTNFSLANVTKVAFKAKRAGGIIDVTVSFSTDDGVTYGGEQTFPLATAANDFTYNVSATGEYSEVRIKFQLSYSGDTPTARSDLIIDDVVVYGITSDPVLAANPLTLSGFEYIEASGPSASQSFELSGVNLDPEDATISIQAPLGFVVSLDESVFQSSLTADATGGSLSETIYVRLAEGLLADEYVGDIAISGGGADAIDVAVNGWVLVDYLYDEKFDNYPETGTSYNSGSFAGIAGNTWNYVNARGTPVIDGKTVVLQNNDVASLNSAINGGISEFAFNYMQAFSTNVNLKVYVNDVLVKTLTTSNEANVVKYSGNITLPTVSAHPFTIEFKRGTGGGQVSIDNFSWNPGPPPAVANPVFAPAPGTYFADQTVFVDNYNDYDPAVVVRYTLDGTEPDGTSLLYDDGAGILLEDGDGPITLKAVAIDGSEQSFVTSGTYVFPFNVANITALRLGTHGGPLYRLTGEAVVTFAQAFRSQKWIQDETAAILIDDNSGLITGSFGIGDGITGIIGSLGSNNNSMQFWPVADAEEPFTPTITVTPTVITMQQFLNDFADYESQLVTLEEVYFPAADGTLLFANGDVLDISDGTDTGKFRSTFFGVDYIGELVPGGFWNITGIINERTTNPIGKFITARNQADFEEVIPEDPILLVSTSSISGLNYFHGMGPSPAKTFSLSGLNLTDVDLTVSGSTTFLVSLDGVTFGPSAQVNQDGGTMDETTVYVKLSGGQDPGDYSGTIEITGGGADASVAVSGSVLALPPGLPYAQNFAEFVFAAETGIENFGDLQEWSFSASGSDLNRLVYRGNWGALSSAGFRGNANVLGYQHTANTGVFTATLQVINDTGEAIDELIVSYVGRAARTGEGRSPAWAVQMNGIPVPELAYSTADGDDVLVTHTFTGLNLAPGELIVLTWSSERGGGSGSSKQIGISNVSVSLLADPVISLAPGVFYEDQVVKITNFGGYSTDVEVFYTLDGTIPDAGSLPYDDVAGILLQAGMGPITLKVIAINTAGGYSSNVAEAAYDFGTVVQVSNIAELRSMFGAKTTPTAYEITGEVVLTLQSDYRNHKYIQDDSGAILIDDPTGVITTLYDLGDGITGITGTLADMNGMLTLVPVLDPGAATNTELVIVPEVKTLDDLTTDDQAKLVTILGVSFATTGTLTSPTNFSISDPSGTGVLRTHYSDLDYVGEPIPQTPKHITGVILQFGTTMQFVPRSLGEFTNPVIDGIEAVADEDVIFGTDEAGAMAKLPETTTIYDDAGNEYTVSLIWSIAAYDGNTPGNYTATGTFVLPDGLDQSDPATTLEVTAIVIVLDEPIAIPLSNWSLFLVMAGMLGTAVWMIRRSWA